MSECRDKKAEWSAKGLEWCVNKLWLDRQETARLKATFNDAVRYRHYTSAIEQENEVLKDANKKLKTVLEDRNITPDRLRITYQDKDCENCEYWDADEGCTAWADYDEDCKHKNIVETVSFYTYKIDDGFITGIRKDLKEAGYDLLKAVDTKTGEVLYEYEGDEEDSDETD